MTRPKGSMLEVARQELSEPEEMSEKEIAERIGRGMKVKSRNSLGILRLNSSTAKKVIDAINLGATRNLAAAYAGINQVTLSKWIMFGRKELTRRLELIKEFRGEDVEGVVIDITGEVYLAPDSLAKLDCDQLWWDNEGRDNQIYVELLYMIRETEAKTALRWLAAIESAVQKGVWTAAAWKLERIFPNDYGRQRHEISGPNGGEIKTRVIFEIPDNGRGDMYKALKTASNGGDDEISELFGEDFDRPAIEDPDGIDA